MLPLKHPAALQEGCTFSPSFPSQLTAVHIAVLASFPPQVLQSTEQPPWCNSSLAEAGKVQPAKDLIY